MLVCICNDLPEAAIKAAIDQGSKTPQEVLNFQGCDPNCCSCFEMIEEMIDNKVPDYSVAKEDPRARVQATSFGNMSPEDIEHVKGLLVPDPKNWDVIQEQGVNKLTFYKPNAYHNQTIHVWFEDDDIKVSGTLQNASIAAFITWIQWQTEIFEGGDHGL